MRQPAESIDITGVPRNHPAETLSQLWKTSRFMIAQLACTIVRHRLESRFEKDAGVSVRGAWVLFAAAEIQTNQKTIAQSLAVNLNVMVKVVDRLEKGGFVRREPNPDNRRERFIVVTPKGKRAIKRIVELSDEIVCDCFQPLAIEEILAFRAQAERIVNFYYESKKPKP